MVMMIRKLKPRMIFHSNFCFSFFWKMAGSIERRAKIIRTNTEFQETASPAVVSWYSVVPALMAIKEGGATPRKVPIKKTFNGTFITGDVILINQLGRNGVILKNIM